MNRSKEGKGKYCIPHKCSYNSLLEFVVTHVEEGAKDWVCQLSTPSMPQGISTTRINTTDIKTILTELQYDNFDEYDNGFRLMAMIKNSAVHEQQAYDLFVEFSRQSPAKFDEESLMCTWSSIGEHERPLTRKSLLRLCRGEDVSGIQIEAIPSVVSIFGKQETDYVKFLKEHNIDSTKLFMEFSDYYKEHCVNAKGSFYIYGMKEALWNEVNQKAPVELAIAYRKEMKKMYKTIKKQIEEEDESVSKHIDVAEFEHQLKSFNKYSNQANNDAKEIIIDSPKLNIKMNSTKHLLPIGNDVINLITGTSRYRESTDYFTFSKFDDNLVYNDTDKDLPCPYWEKVFSKFLSHNTEAIEYFHRLLGCWASGEKYTRCSFIVGRGNNGKTKLLEVIKSILPSCVKFSKELIITKNKHQDMNKISQYILPLDNQRFGITEELTERCELNEDSFKELFGNDEMICKKLYQDEYTANIAVVKCCVPTNHLPKMNASTANKRRLLVIPITCEYVQDKKSPRIDNVNVFYGEDPNILAKEYQDHKSELLRYIVQGARKFYDTKGFHEDDKIPQVFKDAINNYLAESDDIMEMFHSEFLKPCEDGNISLDELAEIYNRVHQVYTVKGEKPMTSKRLGKVLKNYPDPYCYDGITKVYTTKEWLEKRYSEKRGLKRWQINKERWNKSDYPDDDADTVIDMSAYD